MEAAVPRRMQRFDNTTTWFNQSENLEKMIETDQIEIDKLPKRSLWPRILGGVAGATAVAAGALVLIGRRPVPPAVTREVPVVSQPCGTTADENVTVNVNVNENVNENAHASANDTANDALRLRAADGDPLRVSGSKRVARRAAKGAKPVVVSAEVLAGEKLLARGQSAAALREFQREIARHPRDTRALKDACTALKGLGRVNDAARVCRHALAIEPDDLETRARLADIYYSGGAYQWAANEWRRVLASRPTDAQARRGLQRAQARL